MSTCTENSQSENSTLKRIDSCESTRCYTHYFDGSNDDLQMSRHILFTSPSQDLRRRETVKKTPYKRNQPIYDHEASTQNSITKSEEDDVRHLRRSIGSSKLSTAKLASIKSSAETLDPGYYTNIRTGAEVYIVSGRQYRSNPIPPRTPEESFTQLSDLSTGQQGPLPATAPKLLTSEYSPISSQIYPTPSHSRHRSATSSFSRANKNHRSRRPDHESREQSSKIDPAKDVLDDEYKEIIANTIAQQQQDAAILEARFNSRPRFASEEGLGTMYAHIPIGNVVPSGRRIFLIRSGERMDRIFGARWMLTSFTDTGIYLPYDMNQPLTIPEREGGPAEYFNDSPITEMGNICAQMLGRGLKVRGINPTLVVCSPALRCVQTAHNLIKTIDYNQTTKPKIGVEPGFYDFLQWYHEIPNLMTPQQLKDVGFNIDTSYEPILHPDRLKEWKSEKVNHLYERQRTVLANILHHHPNDRDIVVVSHAVTLDACGRQVILGDGSNPPEDNLEHLGIHYPYTSMVACEELKDTTWRTIDQPPQISYLDFDNRINQSFFNRTANN